MTRKQYGPVVIAIPNSATPGTLGSEKAPVVVSRTQGGTPELDLMTKGADGLPGSPITAPDPDDTTGAMVWFGPDGYQGSMWVKDPSTNTWWEVAPIGLPDRIGGVSSIQVNDGAQQTGAATVTINSAAISDATTVGKALLTAADAAAARSAIGAGTGSGGTSGALLPANNLSDVADAPTAVQNLGGPFLPVALDPDTLIDGDVATFDGSSNTWVNRHPIDTGELPYTLHGAILNPGQVVPGDWPSDGIAFVRGSAPVFSMTQIAQGGVQGNGATVTSNGLSQAVAVGDDVFVSISAPAGGSVALIANIDDGSSGANVYTLRGQFLQGTSLQVANYKCRAAAALPSGRTITATLTNGNVLELEMTVHKITGLAASSYDQSGAGGAANVTSLTVSTGGATQYANEVVICSVATFGTNATTGVPAGFTQSGATYSVNPAGATARFNSVYYKLLTATGTPSATVTRSPSGFLAVTLGTYKLA